MADSPIGRVRAEHGHIPFERDFEIRQAMLESCPEYSVVSLSCGGMFICEDETVAKHLFE